MSIKIRLDDLEEEQREEQENAEEQESRVHLHIVLDQFGLEDSRRAGFRFQRCGGGRRVIHKAIGSK